MEVGDDCTPAIGCVHTRVETDECYLHSEDRQHCMLCSSYDISPSYHSICNSCLKFTCTWEENFKSYTIYWWFCITKLQHQNHSRAQRHVWLSPLSAAVARTKPCLWAQGKQKSTAFTQTYKITSLHNLQLCAGLYRQNPFFTWVAYPGILFGEGFNNFSWGQRERGCGGGSPLVRGSGGSCNLIQEISFHIVRFS